MNRTLPYSLPIPSPPPPDFAFREGIVSWRSRLRAFSPLSSHTPAFCCSLIPFFAGPSTGSLLQVSHTFISRFSSLLLPLVLPFARVLPVGGFDFFLLSSTGCFPPLSDALFFAGRSSYGIIMIGKSFTSLPLPPRGSSAFYVSFQTPTGHHNSRALSFFPQVSPWFTKRAICGKDEGRVEGRRMGHGRRLGVRGWPPVLWNVCCGGAGGRGRGVRGWSGVRMDFLDSDWHSDLDWTRTLLCTFC